MLKKYHEWKENIVISEMSARKSFWRTVSKFSNLIDQKKPLAIITSFRGDLTDDKGEFLDDNQKLTKNRKANKILEKNISSKGLSYYPIIGVGQEESDTGGLVGRTEESYIVQPINHMNEEEFIKHIQELLFQKDYPEHQQWGGVVKLPSDPNAYFIQRSQTPATHPSQYDIKNNIGPDIRFRKKLDLDLPDDHPDQGDRYFSQMSQGTAASDSMLDDFEKQQRFLPRKRFALFDKRKHNDDGRTIGK